MSQQSLRTIDWLNASYIETYCRILLNSSSCCFSYYVSTFFCSIYIYKTVYVFWAEKKTKSNWPEQLLPSISADFRCWVRGDELVSHFNTYFKSTGLCWKMLFMLTLLTIFMLFCSLTIGNNNNQKLYNTLIVRRFVTYVVKWFCDVHSTFFCLFSDVGAIWKPSILQCKNLHLVSW